MKRVLICILVSIIVICFVSCAKKDNNIEIENKSQPGIEYDYSMIKTHPYESSGMSVSFSYEDMTEWSEGFIEFVVLSEPEEVTFEYVNQTAIDDAIAQGYSEEDMKIVYNDAIQEFNVQYISIQTENVFYEKEGRNLNQYDKLWLFGDATIYTESFVPGARFAAFVEIMEEDPGIPKDIDLNLFINSYIFYIDENDNLIPFTDNPNLMQYKDYSVEKMADLTVEANAAIVARTEEK